MTERPPIRTLSMWSKGTFCDRCGEKDYCYRTPRGRLWLCDPCMRRHMRIK